MVNNIKNRIHDLVDSAATSTLVNMMEVGTQQYVSELKKIKSCFNKYLDRSYVRYSKIKTLLYRDRPVDLKAHYVPTDFRLNEANVSGKNIYDDFLKNKNNIVVGTAGSGKSVLLRRLFIELIDECKGVIPILVELRLLITPVDDYSIFSFIHKTLIDQGENITKEQLHHALKEGAFSLFLDGFDEIEYDKKDAYEREVLDLSNKYPNVTIVIASRPDDCFSAWDEFHVFHALPLNQEQSIDLISRIDYDKNVKDKFIFELGDGLYQKHRDFLSNPLLLTMMLLTYEQLAEIPEKVHIFYEQAFDTLYHKHDALKSLYKRKSFSALPIDDFKKIFSTFCIISYSDRKMSFSYQEVIDYLGKAIKVEGFNVKSRNFFDDLVKSVCILQKDGGVYTFSHRSFQEYFAAYFISKSQSIDTGKVLDNLVISHYRDNVISMLCELNREQVETKWIIPRLASIIEACKKNEPNTNILGFLSIFYDEIAVHDEGPGFVLTDKKLNGYFVSCLHGLYKNESKSIYTKVDRDDDLYKLKVKRDIDAFLKHTSIKEVNNDVLIADMNNDNDWLSETEIPSSCEKKYKFIALIYKLLTEKYSEKETDLTTLLFNKSDI